MVKGLDIFVAHFENFTDQYILIGGGACDVQMRNKGLPFRATKDLDIVLVVEALSDEFVNHFWHFIKDGEYAIAQVGDRKTFYRFNKPMAEGFPVLIELFSRNPNVIREVKEIHLTDIPTGEEVSSLSAILLDDAYYQFTLSNSEVIGGVRVAGDVALISLKAKAFLNNLKRLQEGQSVQETDILKHKNDIIRLTATLDPGKGVDIPEAIKQDLAAYIKHIEEFGVDVKNVLKNQGVQNLSADQIIKQLRETFSIE
jgi:hypothetical protein